MSLSIEQISAISYPAVLADQRKPTNQWKANSALNYLEKNGFVKRTGLGENIEIPLDYRRNPDTAILASDQDSAALLKTEIITSAVFDIAQLNVPVTWTKGDDAKNPAETQKIAFVKYLLTNALDSHDDELEQRVFTTSSVGGIEINGLDNLVPTSGQGTVGGIDASTETWWRNPTDTYTDASDIEAAMTDMWNTISKGTGGMQPTVVLSGSTPIGLYESQLQSLQRFVDATEADAGFKALAFKGAKFIYSNRGGSKIYFLNNKHYQMVVSNSYFRDKGDTYDVPGQNAFYFLLYSALQNVISNKSQLGVLDVG
jgi:hypothetical protein